ncbi:HAD-IA family hydrolase [Pseudonocardia acaciae]|uniref:HAD-IA family hydrolase n=1 Tax=Pseudonocardia acaciae TaxID=551276 RepID=UPI000491E365|nr:HAD-IA family hydrolase [Pseudonocardia acaciae]
MTADIGWRATRLRTVRRGAAIRARAAGREAHTITTVLLDLGGVVVPTLFEVVDDPGFPRGPFGDDPRYAEVERGRLQEREYWAEVSADRPGLDIGEYFRTRLGVRAEIRELLRAAVGRARIAALTNDMAHWFGDGWPTRFPEFGQFDALLEASKYGVLKPDPSVFRWAAARLDERPRRCLFVDDLPSNLRGAAAVGMPTEHFDVTDPAGSVRRILDRLGIPADGAGPRVFRP